MLIKRVIAIAGTLLAVACNPMPNQLMANAPVAYNPYSQLFMLQYRLVAVIQNALNKADGRVRGNFCLAFVAHTSSQDSPSVQRRGG